MEKYFITKGTKKEGPFSIDDLGKMTLTNDYLIWKEGFEKWKPITEIEELKSIVIETPPPTPLQEKRKKQKSVFLKSLEIGVFRIPAFWLIMFIIMGGFAQDYSLEELYGKNDNFPIFGGADVIRKGLIYASLFISLIISLITTIIHYRINVLKSYKKKNELESEKIENVIDT